MINVKILKNIAVCMLALFTAACGSPTARVDASYGDAVESIVEAQFYDPAAASNPSTDAVEGTNKCCRRSSEWSFTLNGRKDTVDIYYTRIIFC